MSGRFLKHLKDKGTARLTPSATTFSAEHREIRNTGQKPCFYSTSKEEAKNRLAQLAQTGIVSAQIFSVKGKAILDEPVGSVKNQARSLNHEAIDDFQKQSELTKPMRLFSCAEIVPDQIALNLNLIQVF